MRTGGPAELLWTRMETSMCSVVDLQLPKDHATFVVFQPFTQWLTGLAACFYPIYMPIVLLSIPPLPLFKSLSHLWDPPPQRKTRKPIERLSDGAKWPFVAPRVSSVSVCGCSLSIAFTMIRAFELKIHLSLLFYLSPSYWHTYKNSSSLPPPSTFSLTHS